MKLSKFQKKPSVIMNIMLIRIIFTKDSRQNKTKQDKADKDLTNWNHVWKLVGGRFGRKFKTDNCHREGGKHGIIKYGFLF